MDADPIEAKAPVTLRQDCKDTFACASRHPQHRKSAFASSRVPRWTDHVENLIPLGSSLSRQSRAVPTYGCALRLTRVRQGFLHLGNENGAAKNPCRDEAGRTDAEALPTATFDHPAADGFAAPLCINGQHLG